MGKKAAGRCIFCGGFRMSKEHVLANWLNAIFPRSASDTHTHGTVTWMETQLGGMAAVPTRRQRQGGANSKKVRVVCEACNNGWLSSDIQGPAKPIMAPLILGEVITLGRDEQAVIARWVAKTAMAAEFVDRTKIAIPPDHRKTLMDTLSPAAGWHIWMAAYGGTRWQTGLYHQVGRLDSTPHPQPGLPLNVQSTTIGLGHLLLHTISTSIPGRGFELSDPSSSHLVQIWPLTHDTIIWPPTRIADDDDADRIATSLARAYGLVDPGGITARQR